METFRSIYWISHASCHLILYIELCILTLLAYVFVIDIVLVTAMKLRSAVPTFSLMHVITVIIYSLLPGNA